MTTLYFILTGVFAGFTCGLLGIGGGTVVIPALIFMFDFEMKKAIGTSLVFIAAASVMGVIGHQQLNNIDWRAGAIMGLGAVIGVFIGVYLTQIIPNSLLKKIFGICLFIVSIKLIISK